MGAKGEKCEQVQNDEDGPIESRLSRDSRASRTCIMKNLLPGIWQWSWFSEEKQIDFNGLFLTVGEHKILIDPPPMTGDASSVILRNGPIDYIIVTNRDHAREAVKYQGEFGCQLQVPEADAPQMDLTPTKTFKDGELLTGGIWVIQLKDQKSPGESALFIPQGKGVLIVGDALIGKPSGSLSLLSAEKYTDAGKAREGLRRLLKYNFDSLLVGDGVSILTGAKQAVERLLQPAS
jgi:glyoxylase-like metal-dependent hydrolase (beta-lactamase superfamily II)